MSKKWRVGLYVGRFQPVHKGHIYAADYALKKVKELIICIGSAQFSHRNENPFTAGERFTMLRFGLDENNIPRENYWIIPIPDTLIHSLWTAQVTSFTPKFEVVFTNDPLSSELFTEAHIPIREIPLMNRGNYSATVIRQKILNGERWEELTLKSVARFIKKIRGVERIRELAKTD